MLAHSPLRHCELHHKNFFFYLPGFTEQLVFLLFGSVGRGTKCRQPQPHTHIHTHPLHAPIATPVLQKYVGMPTPRKQKKRRRGSGKTPQITSGSFWKCASCLVSLCGILVTTGKKKSMLSFLLVFSF